MYCRHEWPIFWNIINRISGILRYAVGGLLPCGAWICGGKHAAEHHYARGVSPQDMISFWMSSFHILCKKLNFKVTFLGETFLGIWFLEEYLSMNPVLESVFLIRIFFALPRTTFDLSISIFEIQSVHQIGLTYRRTLQTKKSQTAESLFVNNIRSFAKPFHLSHIYAHWIKYFHLCWAGLQRPKALNRNSVLLVGG